MKIQIEVTDDNAFNEGWLRYLLGLDRPERTAEEGYIDPGQNGWDMGADTPTVKLVRHVFTRQNDIDHPQYVVREVLPEDHPDHVNPVKKGKVIIDV